MHSFEIVFFDFFGQDFQAANIRIIQNYDLSTPAVRAQALQLKRVFINLIQNACSAIMDSKIGDTVRIRLWPGPREVQVEVSDNGPGLPDSILKNHAQPAGSHWKIHKGFGQGLMLVHQIVKAYGGKLAFDNSPGGGSKILISFPVASSWATKRI